MAEVRPTPSAAPMAAAPFVWRADGRPAWREMWESFCDLALHGGPPHRGAADALRGPAPSDPVPSSDREMLREMCRGILETTGLLAEEASPGWLAVTCASLEMAEWLRAAIVLENVAARTDGCRLLLPAGPRFTLADEVKSVITVVAKTHHYWSAHVPVGYSPPPAPATSGMPRPLKVGVGGPAGSGKSSLIDALCRRLSGRLGVRVSSGDGAARGPREPDLVLVERAGEDLAAALGPALVDATIGVVDQRAGLELARRGASVVTRSHLLVVNTFDAGTPADRGRVGEALLEHRGGRPVILADCRAGAGVDEVLAWLENDLLLGAHIP
jgi:Ni2+-binding GTPase involved in maturation of urease and hydrogenase